MTTTTNTTAAAIAAATVIAESKVASITITWSEANTFEGVLGQAIDLRFADALAAAARCERNGSNGGYYKTAFTVQFEDGSTHEGRMDISADHEETFLGHVIEFYHSVIHAAPSPLATEEIKTATRDRLAYLLAI